MNANFFFGGIPILNKKLIANYNNQQKVVMFCSTTESVVSMIGACILLELQIRRTIEESIDFIELLFPCKNYLLQENIKNLLFSYENMFYKFSTPPFIQKVTKFIHEFANSPPPPLTSPFFYTLPSLQSPPSSPRSSTSFSAPDIDPSLSVFINLLNELKSFQKFTFSEKYRESLLEFIPDLLSILSYFYSFSSSSSQSLPSSPSTTPSSPSLPSSSSSAVLSSSTFGQLIIQSLHQLVSNSNIFIFLKDFPFPPFFPFLCLLSSIT